MSHLVAVFHPPTGKTLYMHPDLAAAPHRWLHPDPSVPTPLESLPLFESAEVLKFARLATQHVQHTTPGADVLTELAVNHA